MNNHNRKSVLYDYTEDISSPSSLNSAHYMLIERLYYAITETKQHELELLHNHLAQV